MVAWRARAQQTCLLACLRSASLFFLSWGLPLTPPESGTLRTRSSWDFLRLCAGGSSACGVQVDNTQVSAQRVGQVVRGCIRRRIRIEIPILVWFGHNHESNFFHMASLVSTTVFPIIGYGQPFFAEDANLGTLRRAFYELEPVPIV